MALVVAFRSADRARHMCVCSACGAMKDDFIATLKSARDLPMALLKRAEIVFSAGALA